jgi:ubiquinone biosynthesis monooxygenase Coq7
MRVNHAGEVAAQALYQGQALTARLDDVRDKMREAAIEEQDHLAWCEARLRELGSQPSLLNPLWYSGSFAIGALAGLAGDRWSLGFVAETEQQVVEHLESHLGDLPAKDQRSREVVTKMRDDEAEHRDTARDAGGAALPGPVRGLMRAVAGIMTRTAYRL